MLYGLYLSTAGAKNQSWRQDIIANNIANVDTTGFRRHFAVIRERASHDREFGLAPPTRPPDAQLQDVIGGLDMFEAPIDFDTQGGLKTTLKNLDTAIHGQGFFQVQRGEETFLTRNGAFALDNEGFLTTDDRSARVLNIAGGPIQLNGTDPVQVTTRGQVFQNGVLAGQIALVMPADSSQMAPVGDSLFAYTGDLGAAAGAIQQNVLEDANVDPIREMVGLIESARAFEMNLNMIQLQNDGLRTLIQQVPRLA